MYHFLIENSISEAFVHLSKSYEAPLCQQWGHTDIFGWVQILKLLTDFIDERCPYSLLPYYRKNIHLCCLPCDLARL